MKPIRILTAMLFVLCLFLSASAFAASSYGSGDVIEDFTITTFDGKAYSLYDVLAEKDLVLINIWASWCGPCKSELPYMEEAYRAYGDRIEILALSSEPTDTAEVLSSFAAEHGLTFPVAQDTANLAARFNVQSIPTNIIVDRFGKICYVQAGAMPNTGSFTSLFDLFLGDDYIDTLYDNGFPSQAVNAVPETEEALADALNETDVRLSFTNPSGASVWPMKATEKDDRFVLMSTNADISGSTSLVRTAVDVHAGDALAVTFRLSSQPAIDKMVISVDGRAVKSFTGEHDWTTYAYPFNADGSHVVTISFTRSQGGGEDTLWLDTVELLSGEAAKAAVAANPVYPTASETSMTVTNPEARRIVIEADDASGAYDAFFDGYDMYIVGGTTANITAYLSEDIDPQTAAFVSDYNGALIGAADCFTGEDYRFETTVDTADTTGYSYPGVLFYPSVSASASQTSALLLFADEANADSYVNDYLASYSYLPSFSWRYAEADSSAPLGDVAYTVRFVDQNGEPVSNVMCQVCDDTLCMVFTSDQNGVCEFTLPAYAYEIHLLMAPEGYAGNAEEVYNVPAGGGVIEIHLEKQ